LPARLRDLIRVFAEYGITVEKPRKGSHWKAVRNGTRCYPVPASNAEKTEIDDNYIRGACRNFELDLDEVKRKLR
jgi:hypothetical protein